MTKLSRDEIVRLDRAHVWHPYTSIDAWDEADPIVVARAEGAFFWDADGTRYIDGNASWWVAVARSRAPAALARPHGAGETRSPTARSPASPTSLPPPSRASSCAVAPRGLNHVFYTDNGSTSVEVAIKIALQTWRQRGAPKKTRFIALDGAFHGDTLGATSLGGDRSLQAALRRRPVRLRPRAFPGRRRVRARFRGDRRRRRGATRTPSRPSSSSRSCRAPRACAPMRPRCSLRSAT